MQRLKTVATVFGCALLAGVIAGTSVTDASGVTFAVTKLVEDVGDVDENPGDGTCATVAGECTLRAAAQESNALPGPQTIFLPPGDHTLVRGGCCEDDADTGDVDITDDTTIVGAGTEQTAITEVSPCCVERVLDVKAPAAVAIRDLAVRDVFMSVGLPQGTEYCGGGIRNAGSLTLLRVNVIHNVFRRSGGGICNQGELHIMDSTISGNQAGLIGGGGGIRNEGVAVLERVAISDNISDTLDGGGVGNYGGVNRYGVAIEARLTITDSTISANTSRYSGTGAGVASVGQGAEATVVNSTISGNNAEGSSTGRAQGGGVSAYAGGRITLVNSTITGNQASLPGGGLSSEPGYLPGQGVITLVNTIVAGNENGDCAGAMTSGGHNLDSDGTCGLTSAGDISGVAPLLGPLADNGGPTQTHALLEGSPAVDAGGGDQCPGHDQRGAPRPFDGDGAGGAACDIGAYEYGAEPGPFPPPLSGDVDCSATVEAVDALSLLRHVAGLPPLAACLDLGDVDCDSGIDAVDALLVLRYVAALPVSLPPGCPPIGPPSAVAIRR